MAVWNFKGASSDPNHMAAHHCQGNKRHAGILVHSRRVGGLEVWVPLTITHSPTPVTAMLSTKSIRYAQLIFIQWASWASFVRLLTAFYVVMSSLLVFIFVRLGGWYQNMVAQLVVEKCLTIDLKRTNTYLGCAITQAVMNVLFTIFTLVDIGTSVPSAIVLGVCMPLAGFASLCLLAFNLWPLWIFRRHMPIGKLWKVNAKDTLQGTISPLTSLYPLSVIGRPRNVPIIGPCVVSSSIHAMRSILTPLFFRRVSPAETLIYVFSRNLFAVIAIVITVFRAVTALQKAQNQMGTRIKSRTCHLEKLRPIHMLVEYSTGYLPLPQIIVKTLSMGTHGMEKPQSRHFDCKRTESEHQVSQRINRTLESYFCSNLIAINVNAADSALDVHVSGLSPVDYRGELPVDCTPRMWLSTEEGASGNLTFRHPPRSYLSPWELCRGSHIEVEAKLVTRKLITSLIWRDIILSSDPPVDLLVKQVQVYLCLFSRAFHTTHHTQQQAPYDSLEDDANICDYIEDYRSGSVLDVVGSVDHCYGVSQVSVIPGR
ncbi:hypothetical protein AG1IA_09648 [Rhizoctonia solani AG-1 IA]|uniref:Uncharacterized protein n=1 Tax=Thanatephorus cucumeris (strain AG1-IA) TaxID=983506 RepID=L8WHY5_THACA|nr:hypothetical protein AG1IA_09648 [Rhizoctonia solani AG-1 IA]